MAGLSISKAWDETRAILARDGKLLVSVALALIVLPAAILGLLNPPLAGDRPAGWIQAVSLVVALVGIAGQIAIIRLALASPTVVGEAIGYAFKRLLPVFAALILFGVAVALVLTPLFLVLAGMEALRAAAAGTVTPAAGRAVLIVVVLVVLLVARFQLITPVGAAEEIGPIRILKRSWALSKGQYWRLLAFILLTLFLMLIVVFYLGQIMGGVLVGTLIGSISQFSVGALIAGLIGGIAQGAFTVVISVMIARIYTQLAGRTVEPSVPHSAS